MKNSSIFAIRKNGANTPKNEDRGAVIKSLYIKNYALIDELEVSFGAGLNILTGQTGAGKSIIIGALNVVLGDRADTDTVREGTRKAVVEAVIGTGGRPDPVVERLMDENEIDRNESEIILRREIRPTGSRAFVNDTPVNLSALRIIGDRLVDLHGQHDHQLLLKQDHHREVIDDLPAVRPAALSYKEQFDKVKNLRSELNQLQRRERELQEKMELYRFQLQELEAADLDPVAFEELESEMKRLDHAEELDEKAALVNYLGSESEHSLMDLMTRIEEAIQDMTGMDEEFGTYLNELQTAKVSVQELLSYAEQYRSRIEFNPDRLEELRRKQAEIRRLEKKYGLELSALAKYREEIKESVNLAENYDLELEKKQKELADAAGVLRDCAEKLHGARLEEGAELGKRISDTLRQLGIPNNRFETSVSWRYDDDGWIEIDGRPVACGSDGPDDVIFYISTNKGESPKPLASIASGGEISRVMLAMKSVIAREQHLPVMIFDEIDTGIGGAVAEQVGKTMHDLSKHCQIIAITHQAQIAGQADHHFSVQKQESDDRTVTRIIELDDEAHIREVASLMSGSEISEYALASARELVDRAKGR